MMDARTKTIEEITDPTMWNIASLLYATFPKTKYFSSTYFGDLCGVGLRPSQNMIIALLDESKECSMSELAETLTIAKANMTTLVDPLVERGYVNREPGKKDRRVILISLTEKGQKYLDDCKMITYNRLSERLSTMPKDDLEELEGAIQSLHRLLF